MTPWFGLNFGVCFMKAEVFLPDEYSPADDEPFMNSTQMEYFTRKLLSWKNELLSDNKDTIETLQAIHEPFQILLTVQVKKLTVRSSYVQGTVNESWWPR